MNIIVKITKKDSGTLRLFSPSIYEFDFEKFKTIGDLIQAIYNEDIRINKEESTLSSPQEIRLLYRSRVLNPQDSIEVIRDAVEKGASIPGVIPKSKSALKNSKTAAEFFMDKNFFDLNQVGLQKSLGSLSFNTIETGGYNIAELITEFEKKGLMTMTYKQLLYVYHELSCQRYLTENVEKLQGWPEDAHQFIRKLSQVIAKDEILREIINNLFEDTSIVQSRSNNLLSL